MKQRILIFTLCIALQSLLFACSREDQMRADVDKLIAAAKKQTSLWPWGESSAEVLKVAAYGKAVAPMLLELLCDKPDEDFNCLERHDWKVQQQAALALCNIYGVDDSPGHVYSNRASIEENAEVKAFWVEMVTKKKK